MSLLMVFLCSSLLQHGPRVVTAGGKRLGEAGEQREDEVQGQGWGQKLRRRAVEKSGVWGVMTEEGIVQPYLGQVGQEETCSGEMGHPQ